MASFPLPRFLEQRSEQRQQARELVRVTDDLDADLRARKPAYRDPADSLTLRGIPAVGRGVAGVIRGTQPESAVAS